MIHITSEELRTLARAARLKLPGDAQERLVNKLEAVLSYAELLSTVPPLPQAAEQSQKLLVRADTTAPSIPEELLQLAPQTEAHYFIVPVVISK